MKNIPISKPLFSGKEIDRIKNVLRSGWIMQGSHVGRFEDSFRKYVSSREAVAVSSGTAALHLGLLAIGIGEGDEVIAPSYSFIASCNAIYYTGAKPVFIDIDKNTFNIDPGKIESLITKKTKALMVVHQFGLPADMDEIEKKARKFRLKIIEDSACALGSSYKNRKIGSSDNINCFSFHPRKIITTGEGGMISTSSKKLALKIRSLRSHGFSGQKVESLGYNYRMTDIQAAIGIEQMRDMEDILKRRIKLAERYSEAFSSNRYIDIPFVPGYVKTFNYQSYVIRLRGGLQKSSLEVIKRLNKRGIMAKPGIVPIHKEPYYRKRYGKIRLPNTEKVFSSSIILPLYPSMTTGNQDRVIKALKGEAI